MIVVSEGALPNLQHATISYFCSSIVVTGTSLHKVYDTSSASMYSIALVPEVTVSFSSVQCKLA